MGIRTKVLAVATALAVFSTSGFAQSTGVRNEKPKALFVQQADSATLVDGKLKLDDPSSHMIVFADRPLRAASAVPVEELIALWNKGTDNFAEDPPNAVLIGEIGGKATSLIVEISNPQLSNNELTFDYSIIDGQDSVKLEKSFLVIDETWWGDLDLVAGTITGNTLEATLPNAIYSGGD